MLNLLIRVFAGKQVDEGCQAIVTVTNIWPFSLELCEAKNSFANDTGRVDFCSMTQDSTADTVGCVVLRD